MTTTLASCTIDGVDVLIVKDEEGIYFASCGKDFTPDARAECLSIADVHRLANRVPTTAPRCPQVKCKGILGWLRAIYLWTPLKTASRGRE